MSPKKYINGLKIEKSKQLLRGSKLPIGEICDLLGFHDCAYFVKLFKDIVGISPSAYRNRR